MEKEYLIQAEKHLKKVAVKFYVFAFLTCVFTFFNVWGITLMVLSTTALRERSKFDEFKKGFQADRNLYAKLTVLELQQYTKMQRNSFILFSGFLLLSLVWKACGGEIKGLVCFVYFIASVCIFFIWKTYRKKLKFAEEENTNT